MFFIPVIYSEKLEKPLDSHCFPGIKNKLIECCRTLYLLLAPFCCFCLFLLPLCLREIESFLSSPVSAFQVHQFGEELTEAHRKQLPVFRDKSLLQKQWAQGVNRSAYNKWLNSDWQFFFLSKSKNVFYLYTFLFINWYKFLCLFSICN